MAKWIIDPEHSVVKFSVRHFMIANVIGLFSKITGVIQSDPPDMSHLFAEAEIEVKSLTTGNTPRDEHLLRSDYFDAANHPRILFKTTRVEPMGPNRAKVTGELSIRGIKRPVTLEVEAFGPVKSPFSGNTCIGFWGATKISREEYGMTVNDAMEGGGLVVGKDVEITFDLEADLAKE